MDARILRAMNATAELAHESHLCLLAARVKRARKFGYGAHVLLVKQVCDVDGYPGYYLHLLVEVEGYAPESYWLPWLGHTLEIIEDVLRPDEVVEIYSARHYG